MVKRGLNQRRRRPTPRIQHPPRVGKKKQREKGGRGERDSRPCLKRCSALVRSSQNGAASTEVVLANG